MPHRRLGVVTHLLCRTRDKYCHHRYCGNPIDTHAGQGGGDAVLTYAC